MLPRRNPIPRFRVRPATPWAKCWPTQRKIAEAQAAYEAAAKVNPSQAGMYYQNEAIIMYPDRQQI